MEKKKYEYINMAMVMVEEDKYGKEGEKEN
jgi:hypothetical protein